jgi:hypothetical protein
MLFEPFQNVQQLRFVGVARKSNYLLSTRRAAKTLKDRTKTKIIARKFGI